MHTLPALPYDYKALEPVIDGETMTIHHTKHHQTYIDKLNSALESHEDLKALSVEDLLLSLDKVPTDIKTAVITHGGGHFNHSLFWQILRPAQDNNLPEGKLAEAIDDTFGSFDEFKKLFTEKASGQFGSGWAWLVITLGKLEVKNTPNQNSPLMEGQRPILGIDVWEHAYYLKYQNKRVDYIENFFSIVNWEKVGQLYEKYSVL